MIESIKVTSLFVIVEGPIDIKIICVTLHLKQIRIRIQERYESTYCILFENQNLKIPYLVQILRIETTFYCLH